MEPEVTISDTIVCTCSQCGHQHTTETFPLPVNLDQIQIDINKLMLMYCLLDFTQNNEYVDFDDFRNIWSSGFVVTGMDLSDYGVDIGLLDHYEDACYFVNQEIWKQLYTTLSQFFTFHKTTV